MPQNVQNPEPHWPKTPPPPAPVTITTLRASKPGTSLAHDDSHTLYGVAPKESNNDGR